LIFIDLNCNFRVKDVDLDLYSTAVHSRVKSTQLIELTCLVFVGVLDSENIMIIVFLTSIDTSATGNNLFANISKLNT
jgi:hypothetical protein